MPDEHVRPFVNRLTDSDARHLLADGLIRACYPNGPSRVALAAGCDEKTIRRARDEETALGLSYVMNLLDVDEHALDALFAAKGFLPPRRVRAAGGDIIPSAAATIHHVSMARSPSSPGGVKETDAELLAMESALDELIAAADTLKARIMAAKLGRAA